MFGLSFSELLLIAVVAAAVWYAVRRARRGAPGEGRSGQRRSGADSGAGVEDMVKCPVCGLYVLARAPTACERGDCPYRA